MEFKRIKHIFLKIFFGMLLLLYAILVALFAFLYIGRAPEATKAQDAVWGVNFSQRQAEALGLDWRETFLALADDLNAEYWRIPVYWDEVEENRGEFNFEPWDWQLAELAKRDAKVVLAVGFKLPRWPECHFPGWAEELEQTEKEAELFKYIREVVSRYRDNPEIIMWQVENEPFLWPFGECPRPDADLLDVEIELVRELDARNNLDIVRPIMVTDSGEWSTWLPAGMRADVFGSTLYRIIHHPRFGLVEYKFFTPTFHWRKGVLLRMFRPDIPIQVIELQAEPWVTVLPLSEASFEEQDRTMNLERFRETMDFALATGYDTFYLWGVEWIYWLKSTQDKPEIWEEARKLFNN